MAGTVRVESLTAPLGGWKVAYDGPLPQREDPDAPGLFPPGGCYLRKLHPHGTACYYWGRLDKEWDLVHRRYGRRLVVNFADAPGDLAADGRTWTTVKDYAQWHEVARTITGHLIDRYGADALDFSWSISHESCPEWNPPPDEAAADSYLGNGYFPSWCADVVRRQLGRAAADPRFAYGETILTVWPPPGNFAGMNAVTRILLCDDNGDGRADRQVTIQMPIFHALGLLSDMGDRYWVLPDRQVGGHVVAGFASRAGDTLRVLLYTHHAQDTQSRSDAAFDVTLDLTGLGWEGSARVHEYRFDRDHNSYFRQGRALREPPAASFQEALNPRAYSRAEVEQIQALAECRATASASHPRAPDGRLRLTARVAGNGLNFLVIEPDLTR